MPLTLAETNGELATNSGFQIALAAAVPPKGKKASSTPFLLSFSLAVILATPSFS
jgi:hypothetical protein